MSIENRRIRITRQCYAESRGYRISDNVQRHSEIRKSQQHIDQRVQH